MFQRNRTKIFILRRMYTTLTHFNLFLRFRCAKIECVRCSQHRILLPIQPREKNHFQCFIYCDLKHFEIFGPNKMASKSGLYLLIKIDILTHISTLNQKCMQFSVDYCCFMKSNTKIRILW